MNIYIIEPFMSGNIHVPFNASLLSIWRSLFKRATLHLWAEKEHMEHLHERVSDLSYDKKKILSVLHPRTANKWDWFRKHLQECWILLRGLLASLFVKNPVLVFSFISPIGLFFLNSLLGLFFKKVKVVVVLHGLEILKPEAQQKKVDRLYARLWAKAFKKKNSNMRYLVLQPSVALYLQKQGFLAEQELFVIPHPYPFSHFTTEEKDVQDKISFVHLGMARLSKRSEQFFELASRFKGEIEAGMVEFRVVGAVQPEMIPFLHSCVAYATPGEIIPHGAYETWCKQADYAVFCYEEHDYELTSSGAIMDAICFGLPILGLKNNVIASLFDLVDPAPGILCSHLDVLEEVVRNIIHLKKSMKTELNASFKALQRYFSIEYVESVLKEQLGGYLDVEG